MRRWCSTRSSPSWRADSGARPARAHLWARSPQRGGRSGFHCQRSDARGGALLALRLQASPAHQHALGGHAPCPTSGEICTAPLDSIARDCRLFPGSPTPPKPLKSARNEGVRGSESRVGSSLSGPSRPFCIVPRSLKGGPRRPQAAGRGAERPLRTAGARARERRGVLGVPQSYDPAPQWLGRGLRRCAVVPPLPVRGPGPGARAGGAAGRVGCAMYSPFSARPHQGPRATRYLTAGDTRA